MRYKIYYQESGSNQLNKNNKGLVDSDKLLIKLREHKILLDKELGPNNWAYTGSCAVIVYGLSENVDITQVPEPDDINVIYKTDLSHVDFTTIGNYKIGYETKHSSTEFIHQVTEDKLDIIPVKELYKNTIMGFPLAKLHIMNSIYKDLENGQVIGNDLIKALILDEVLEKNPTIDGTLPKPEPNEYNLPVIPLYT